jgi:hypothetical protein
VPRDQKREAVEGMVVSAINYRGDMHNTYARTIQEDNVEQQ